jgi:hypothetical protein
LPLMPDCPGTQMRHTILVAANSIRSFKN